ncbi:hypothetical protein MSAN_00364800 [Mycena sanguinolenta]|uniref:Uncharacterized protein n=1 Tax=Mycena sanguinolenta TaxID=230812 RepID=A0A8H6Z936_9AGAR|nr:hypothetical protein MSAN_00364800 [Mycena sanguinolenta]
MDNAAQASSSNAQAPESRPQAGPLPRKRGEIGYDESKPPPPDTDAARSGSPTAPLPERHPADRDAAAAAASGSNAAAGTPGSPSLTTLPASSTDSLNKRKRLLGFLHPKKVPAYGGLRLTTLLLFFTQLLLVGGTIAGWYFAVSHLSSMTSSSSSGDNSNGGDNSNNNNSNPNSNGGQTTLGNASTSIFVHVVFGVLTLIQLLFLERRIFRLRAERYSYVHPGEILPSARRRMLNAGDSGTSLAFSPWNRPPLPTYAAALAQSGVGTGDVEDHLIAAPPPPAYGNTRGSTFLLSGFLSDRLRAQRPVSTQTNASGGAGAGAARWSTATGAARAREMAERGERPR